MTPCLEIASVVFNYHALRPLRIRALTLEPGSQIAILGLDAPAAEALINVVTAAALPDAGSVRLFGRETSAITSSDEWLGVIDRFGIVSERAAMLETFSPVQNLAMPFTLEVEPPSAEVRERAESLAREVDVRQELWDRPLRELAAADRLRVRLGRALALDPSIVLLEHPSATLERTEVAAVAASFRRAIRMHTGRDGVSAASLTLTADPRFADAIAGTVLELDPASGALRPARRGWFGRGFRDR